MTLPGLAIVSDESLDVDSLPAEQIRFGRPPRLLLSPRYAELTSATSAGTSAVVAGRVIKPIVTRRIVDSTTSVVIRRRLLQLRVRAEVVLDPDLGPGLGQVILDHGARGGGLLNVELVVGRRAMEGALRRIVVEVAGDHHAPRGREPQYQYLVSGVWPGAALITTVPSPKTSCSSLSTTIDLLC